MKTKKYLRNLFFATIWISGFLSQNANAQLSIDSCIAKARTNYPLIKQYRLIEQSAHYSLSNASKGYLPQLSFSARASYQSDVTEIPLQLPGIDPLTKDQYNISVDLNQNVWDGGNIHSRKKITRANSEVETQQLNVELYAINERVNQLFFGILLLEEQLKQNDLYQKELQRDIEQISSFMANGLANQADVDAVKVALLEAKQNQAGITSAHKSYIEMLAAMIGEPISNNTIFLKPSIKIPSLEQNNRPELQLFNAQQNLSESQKSAILAQNMPKLGLFAQGGYAKPGLNMLDGDFQSFYIVGARFTWGFGGLYTQKNDYRQIETAQNKISVQKETFLFNTHLQATQQNNEIEKALEIMKYDEEIINLRGNVKKSAEAKVANGTLSVTEYLREVNAENLAKQDKAVHEIELLMKIYALRNTLNNW